MFFMGGPNVEQRNIRIAMGQMQVVAGEPERNVRRACSMIREAAADRCEVIVLPECMDIGWTHPGARELAQPIPGIYSAMLCAAAKEAGIYVVAGLTERSGSELYNAALLISPEGDILAKHRKINELDIAHDLYSIGDSLSVTRTPLGVIGINVCADNSPNSLALAHSQARMGAQIILSPSAWAVPSDYDNEQVPYGEMWRDSYQTLSKLYDMPVIGVSNVGPMIGGPWAGWKCIGCSLAVDSNGEVLVQGPYGEQAEALIPVEVTITERHAKGTSLTGKLAERGYVGP
jgi:predicted amidohydrolase